MATFTSSSFICFLLTASDAYILYGSPYLTQTRGYTISLECCSNLSHVHLVSQLLVATPCSRNTQTLGPASLHQCHHKHRVTRSPFGRLFLTTKKTESCLESFPHRMMTEWGQFRFVATIVLLSIFPTEKC